MDRSQGCVRKNFKLAANWKTTLRRGYTPLISKQKQLPTFTFDETFICQEILQLARKPELPAQVYMSSEKNKRRPWTLHWSTTPGSKASADTNCASVININLASRTLSWLNSGTVRRSVQDSYEFCPWGKRWIIAVINSGSEERYWFHTAEPGADLSPWVKIKTLMWNHFILN